MAHLKRTILLFIEKAYILEIGEIQGFP